MRFRIVKKGDKFLLQRQYGTEWEYINYPTLSDSSLGSGHLPSIIYLPVEFDSYDLAVDRVKKIVCDIIDGRLKSSTIMVAEVEI